MTDISQTQAGCKAKSRRNPLWIPRLFNAKSRCVCRNRRYFRLFRYTLVKRCHARGRHTFGKYVQTGSAAKLAANLAYYIIPARQIKPINPQKRPLFLRQFYKNGQNARQPVQPLPDLYILVAQQQLDRKQNQRQPANTGQSEA